MPRTRVSSAGGATPRASVLRRTPRAAVPTTTDPRRAIDRFFIAELRGLENEDGRHAAHARDARGLLETAAIQTGQERARTLRRARQSLTAAMQCSSLDPVSTDVLRAAAMLAAVDGDDGRYVTEFSKHGSIFPEEIERAVERFSAARPTNELAEERASARAGYESERTAALGYEQRAELEFAASTHHRTANVFARTSAERAEALERAASAFARSEGIARTPSGVRELSALRRGAALHRAGYRRASRVVVERLRADAHAELVVLDSEQPRSREAHREHAAERARLVAEIRGLDSLLRPR